MAFFFKRRQPVSMISYDPQRQQPAIRKSICTGEAVGGLMDLRSGDFHEIQLLRDEADLQDFCRRCGKKPEELKTIY
jgi:hypothetical protein